jgi:hypothetical protein
VLLYLNILQTVLLIIIASGIAYLVFRSRVRTAAGARMSLRLRQREVYNDVVRVLTMLGKRKYERRNSSTSVSARRTPLSCSMERSRRISTTSIPGG